MIEQLESRSTVLIVVSITVFVLLTYILLLIVSVVRRVKNSILYRKMDEFKSYYRDQIYNIIKSKNIEITSVEKISLRGNSSRGKAFVETLIELYNLDPNRINEIARMYEVDKYFINKLKSHSSGSRLEAVKVLTSLGFVNNFKEIIYTLQKEENSGILYRMLFYLTKNLLDLDKIEEVIRIIFDKYKDNKLSFREVSVLLSNIISKLYINEIGRLIELLSNDEYMLMALLDALFSSDKENIPIDSILNLLNRNNPEILARALRVIARFKDKNLEKGYNLVQAFLNHPVWYVRLNAVKALESFRCNRSTVKKIAELIYDDNWQVRSVSADMLVRCMAGNFDIMLAILESKDEYAKQALAEAISKANAGVKFLEVLSKCGTEDLLYITKLMEILYYDLGFVNTIRQEDIDEVKKLCTI